MKTLSKTIFPKECIQYPNTEGLFLAEARLGYTKYIIDTDFIHLIRYALSTECISELNPEQLSFFMDWIDYNVTLMNGEMPYSRDNPIVTLDYELVKIAECIPNPGEIICGNSNIHVYNSCPT
jgi:hypothetical protein